MKVIQKEVEARESSEGTKIKSQPVNPKPHTHGHNPPISSTFTTQGHNIQCVYCSGQHYSASCDMVKFVKDRKDILIKSDHCFNCLKPIHKTRDCRSQRTCRICHQRHHQSICNNLFVEPKPFVPPPTIPQTNTTITLFQVLPQMLLKIEKWCYYKLHMLLLGMSQFKEKHESECYLIVVVRGHI